MGNIPSARLSPRIEHGIIYWSEGDTFDLVLSLRLTDQDGDEIDIAPDSTVIVRFCDRREQMVKEFVFTGVQGNTVTLEFDSAVTELFPAGEYRYDVLYTAGERTTVSRGNLAVAE